MRNRIVSQAFLVILMLLNSQWLVAQTAYPIQGQPQGGDRRGSYYYEDDEAQRVYDQQGEIPRLYPDPKIYIHNMTLLAHVKRAGRGFGAGEMMTVGGNRYLFSGGVVLDVTNPKEPVIINGEAPRGELAYNQSLQKWILMRSDTCCRRPNIDVILGEAPHPGLNIPPGERVGVTFFDATDPRNVVEISHFSTGPGSVGTHGDGNYYDGGRYAYLTSAMPGTRGQLPYNPTSRILQIIDVSDILNPKEAGRWWVPGQRFTEETEFRAWPEAEDLMKPVPETWNPKMKNHYLHLHGPCLAPKRVEDGGTRAYCAYSSLGMRILNISDIQQPQEVGSVDISPPFDAGIPVHSVYPMPQRKLVFMNGETTRWDCHEGIAIPWVVDVRAEEHPVTIATFPIPKPPEDAPYNDFCLRGGRFGTHHPQNIKAPGEARVDLMGYSWFQGGFRLYDVSNPFRPEEVAWIVPAQGTGRGTEAGFIEWDRKIIHVSSDSGLYILSTPVLGEPILGPSKPERWTLEGLNVGAP